MVRRRKTHQSNEQCAVRRGGDTGTNLRGIVRGCEWEAEASKYLAVRGTSRRRRSHQPHMYCVVLRGGFIGSKVMYGARCGGAQSPMSEVAFGAVSWMQRIQSKERCAVRRSGGTATTLIVSVHGGTLKALPSKEETVRGTVGRSRRLQCNSSCAGRLVRGAATKYINCARGVRVQSQAPT